MDVSVPLLTETAITSVAVCVERTSCKGGCSFGVQLEAHITLSHICPVRKLSSVLHCVILNMHHITVRVCAINAQWINPMGHYM